MTFDATSREFCQVRRVRTNTPLQALTLLNDPASFEAARALATRIVKETAVDATARARAAHGMRLVLSREATDQELARLVGLFESEQRHYSQSLADAERIAGARDANAAAWTIVANVLLNLDEAVTKQ
jgi:hypothetical protein